MHVFVPFLLLLTSAAAGASEPMLPMSSGEYTFELKDAEFPNFKGTPIAVTITGHHIVVVNRTTESVYPVGIIDEGTLMWHGKSKQWIIGHNESDRTTREIGGCSGGPTVVDFERRIYWTC